MYPTAFRLSVNYFFFATPSIIEQLITPIFQVVNSLILFALVLFLAWLLHRNLLSARITIVWLC